MGRRDAALVACEWLRCVWNAGLLGTDPESRGMVEDLCAYVEGVGMPTVMVGGVAESASELEVFLAALPKGTPVEWSGSRFPGVPPSGVGVLLFTWWYDGVVAEVDSGGRRLHLHPDSDPGLSVVRLEDTRRLNGPGLGGDGI